MIQQITISIEVPAGYEATGEYRAPVNGDYFLCEDNKQGAAICHRSYAMSRVILRKLWAFPAWFAAGWWLVKCNDGVSSNKYYVVPTESAFPPGIMAASIWAFHGETFTPPTVDKLQCVR